MSYDPNNIFARILRKEIPCDLVFEDDHVLSFRDVSPKASVHVLLIPKGPYKNASYFSKHATSQEIVAFTRAIDTIGERLHLTNTGYRLISNNGVYGGQEVPHFHVHILGGKALPAW